MANSTGFRSEVREPTVVGARSEPRLVPLVAKGLAPPPTRDVAASVAPLSAPRSVLAAWDVPSPSRVSTREWRWARRAVTGLVFTGLTSVGVLVGLGGASVSPMAAGPSPVENAGPDVAHPGAVRPEAVRPEAVRSEAARPGAGHPAAGHPAARPAPGSRTAAAARPGPGHRPAPAGPPVQRRTAPGAP